MMMRRVPALDGIRGWAILFVVAGHISSGAAPLGGVVGVTLFFVLSGYLITSLLVGELDQRGRIDFRAFYIRRALRLFPALAVVVAVCPALLLATEGIGGLRGYWLAAAAVILYAGDFVRAGGGTLGILNHTWSLAVEEQFYLLWPLLLALLARLRRFRSIVIALTVLAISWRLAAAALLGFDRIYYAPDTNAFALLVGCAVALLPRAKVSGNIVSWCAVPALMALVVTPMTHARVTFVALAVTLIGGLLVASADGATAALITDPTVRWFGRISYGLYLWHQVFLSLRLGGEEPRGIIRVALAGVAVLVSWASFRYLEKPILGLKNRFIGLNTRPSRSPARVL